MPLDDAIPDPTLVTNRAIGVAAPPEAIWPWIAQMGESPRGGFYSYTSIERMLGMRVRNATTLLPEFQDPKAGDVIDRAGNMRVKAVVPGECLVLGPPPGLDFDSTWAVGVYPDGPGRSRIVSRVRAKYRRWTPFLLVMFLLLDPGQLIMERKMLMELRKRAENGQGEADVDRSEASA
jgi:hypothetical protein